MLRKQKGLSQEALCKASGLSIRFVSSAENDPQNLTLESLEKIAKALGVGIAEIVGDPMKGMPRPSKKTAEALDQAIKVLQAYRALVD